MDVPAWRLLVGDARDRLAGLEAGSAHTVVTSPPYFGLRDYGTGEWAGGDPACDHVKPTATDKTALARHSTIGQGPSNLKFHEQRYTDVCGKCGARRVDRQLGLEPTPDEFVAALVDVFRGVRRVLRDDGTVWLNLGDSYAANISGGLNGSTLTKGGRQTPHNRTRSSTAYRGEAKHKDLLGIPWMVAFALRQPWYAGRIKSEIDRVWLAAMIDAEGCVYIHRRREGQNNGQGYVRKTDSFGSGLEVANTSLRVVERCREITGRGSISRQDKDRRQPLYRWCLRTNECRDVLREVYPYLVAKQHEARLACGVPSSGERATAAWEALKLLHGGGLTDVDFAAPASLHEPGWYLRMDNIWSKLNPMPESVTDRPTKAHEYIFLLSKAPRYYFDADAIREDAETFGRQGSERDDTGAKNASIDPKWHRAPRDRYDVPGRNKRSVWTVATQPYAGAHFATFPPKLIEPCILAGAPERACGECGAPWVRVVERAPDPTAVPLADRLRRGDTQPGNATVKTGPLNGDRPVQTLGFEPSCSHDDGSAQGVVLDPFTGAGTTGLVALQHRREFVGIELSLEYAAMARDRIETAVRLGFRAPERGPDVPAGQAALFEL